MINSESTASQKLHLSDTQLTESAKAGIRFNSFQQGSNHKVYVSFKQPMRLLNSQWSETYNGYSVSFYLAKATTGGVKVEEAFEAENVALNNQQENVVDALNNVDMIEDELGVELNTEQDINLFINKVVDLVDLGKDSEAIRLLESNIMLTYQSADAVSLLSSLLMQSGNVNKAATVSEDGLRLNSDNIELRRLLAQARFMQGNYQSAYKVLFEASPSLNKYPDYYALLASAAVELKEYRQAEGIYMRLVEHFPNRGDWWAGLGIVNQASGQYNQALNSYKRALQTGDLSPYLVGYVREQIGLLL